MAIWCCGGGEIARVPDGRCKSKLLLEPVTFATRWPMAICCLRGGEIARVPDDRCRSKLFLGRELLRPRWPMAIWCCGGGEIARVPDGRCKSKPLQPDGNGHLVFAGGAMSPVYPTTIAKVNFSANEKPAPRWGSAPPRSTSNLVWRLVCAVAFPKSRGHPSLFQRGACHRQISKMRPHLPWASLRLISGDGLPSPGFHSFWVTRGYWGNPWGSPGRLPVLSPMPLGGTHGVPLG